MIEHDLLIKNCSIATCDENFTAYEDGAIGVSDGRIAWLGKADELHGHSAKMTVDGTGKLVAPGLVNAHCHMADSLFRGLVEDRSLEGWLQCLWAAETILDERINHIGARLGLAELALGGVTTVLDMFWFPETAAEAGKQYGMRVHTGGHGFDLDAPDGRASGDRVEHCREFIEHYKDDELVTPVCFVHGTYTTGPESTKAIHALARECDVLFHIHAAETAQENATVMDRYGKRVVDLLDELGTLGPNTLLAHCVHLTDEEIAKLARTGTAVVHNPVSNLKLGSGVAKIPKMLSANITVALGTDGAVSGNDLDMWMATRLAAIMHRGAQNDCLAVKASEALRMATLDGAKALGVADKVGSLEIGKFADVIMLDVKRPHAVPMFDPHTHLVMSAAKSDVDSVWVGGKPIVASKQLLNDDLDSLYDEVNALKPRILEVSAVARGK